MKNSGKSPLEKKKSLKTDFTNVILSHTLHVPQKRLNVNLLNRYRIWVENGKPEMIAEDLQKIIKG